MERLINNKFTSYFSSLALVAIWTGFLFLFREHASQVIITIAYMLAVAVIALLFSRGPAFLSIFISVSALNFLFIPPYYTFSVYDSDYYITFAVMLAIGLIINTQAAILKQKVSEALARERNTLTLYQLTRELTSKAEKKDISLTGIKYIKQALGHEARVWFKEGSKYISIPSKKPDAKYNSILKWCFEHNENAGAGTKTMPGTNSFFCPVNYGKQVLAVVELSRIQETTKKQIKLIEAVSNLLASSFGRIETEKEAEKAKVETETEKLRNLLLTSISHDLRTPLTSIAGISYNLLTEDNLGKKEKDLVKTIHSQSQRLGYYIQNILDITDLESGKIKLKKEPYFLGELIGSAVETLKDALEEREIEIKLEKNLPMVFVDGRLIKQVFINLFNNSIRYSTAGSNITISAKKDRDGILVSVKDEGTGIKKGKEETIFDKFVSYGDKDKKGSGLGLAICKAVIDMHDSKIWAENAEKGGAVFLFTLPIYKKKKGLDHA